MTDEKAQSKVKERAEQAKPQRLDTQAQQSQSNAVSQSVQRTLPGRKPLFRT
jgi:hypothetical protein